MLNFHQLLIIERTFNTHGDRTQLLILAEMLSDLSYEVSKYVNHFQNRQYHNKILTDKIADVIIDLEYLKLILPNGDINLAIDSKVKKLYAEIF